jgi:hypothetical protein
MIAKCCRGNPAQLALAENDDVIEAFPTDRTDQPLRVPVLPERPWGCWANSMQKL